MKETTVEVVLPAVYDNLPEICNRLEWLEQKAPQIIDWDTDSNLNDYVLPGTYICNNGLRTNPGDNLPITNLGDNARIGFTLVVTQATSNENGNHHQVIGQSLILTNRLGSEIKHYSRSKKYVINNAATPPEVTEDVWSPWQELQGATYLGQVTKAQLDTVIDNGIYTGIVIDNELLPQGSTFTMLVINNYAVNSAVGMPAQARQVSQTFFALPLSDISAGAIVPQNTMQLTRTGYGEYTINWGSLVSKRTEEYFYNNLSTPVHIFHINPLVTKKITIVHTETTVAPLLYVDVSKMKIGDKISFEVVCTVCVDSTFISFNGGNDTYSIWRWSASNGALDGKLLHAYITFTKTSETEGLYLCQCMGVGQTLSEGSAVKI